MNDFLREIVSFQPDQPFETHKLVLWAAYAAFLGAYGLIYTKKPAAALTVFLLSVVLYANDFTRELVLFNKQSPLIFTKFSFWVFFAVVLAVDAFFYNKKPLRSLFMFLVSIFFYHKTSGLFFLLLLFTIHMDYFIALWMDRSRDERLRKVLVVVSVAVNLGILCYFKYAYFFTESYNSLFDGHLKVVNRLAVFGNNFSGHDWFRIDKIILPIGISFYTFQTISYTVEVYKRKLEPVRSLIDYGFYVSFFPQVLSGPITRASHFLPQIYKPYSLSREQFGIGVFWILNGLTKKLFVGDYIAVNFIDRIYANPTMYTGVENLLAILSYSLQVYCDFSGYTDMATGVALLMGFHLTQNFNSPYKAEDVGDFWRRWHISLSSWLRDYLYIPLGGNRTATRGTFFWLVLIGSLVGMLTYTYFKTGFPDHLSLNDNAGVLGFLLFAVVAFIGLIAYSYKTDLDPKKARMGVALYAVVILAALAKMALDGGGGQLKAGDVAVFACMLLLALFAPLALFAYLLGGDRFEKLRNLITTEINMMITMLIGGLWHGASWMFIIWGGLNGLGLVVYKRWKKISPFRDRHNTAIRIWGICATYVFISFTRIFFRSPDLDTAKAVINQMVYNFSPGLFFDIVWAYKYVFLVALTGFVFHWLPESLKQKYRTGFANLPMPVMAAVSTVLVFILFQIATGELQRFIYFQF